MMNSLFTVFTDVEYNNWVYSMSWGIDIQRNIEFHVGTNQSLVYDSAYQLMQDVYATEIHDAADVLIAHLFYESRFGWFPEPHEVEEK